MDTGSKWDWSSLGETNAPHEFEAETRFDSSPEPTHTQPKHSEMPEQSEQPSQPEQQSSQHSSHRDPRASSKNKRYGPRTCRICLDVVEPTFPTDTSSTTFGIPTGSPRPTYISDEPELGRLLSPCKCKGSQKYVHEGCLNAWRLANPTEARNYWQCPTCKFTYRLSRLNWASTLSSKWAQVALTAFILLCSIFILGFVADPLFDLWSDPVGTIGDTVTSVVSDIEAMREPYPTEPASWAEHFLKGFFSLGIVGIFKTMVAASPWHWWNIRSSGLAGGGRRHGTGRGRVENISLIFVVIGALTFLMGIWKGVKTLSSRVLKNVSDRVIDVGADDDDDEEEIRIEDMPGPK